MSKTHPTAEDLRSIQSDISKMQKFASLNNIPLGQAINIINMLLIKAMHIEDISDECKKYVWNDASNDVKNVLTGFEYGRKEGESKGFWKGIATCALTIIAVGALLIGSNKK